LRFPLEALRRSWQILDNYALARLIRRPSAAGFWYLPDAPNVTDAASLALYRAADRSPVYLVDYRTRTQFRHENADGIATLPYPRPLGSRVNPEAAFQYALGWHDRFVRDGDAGALEPFLRHARYFRKLQNATGDFPYEFEWFENKVPWFSALAQSRGASVMLRAYLMTGEKAYAASASAALSRFGAPCESGGFAATFPLTRLAYFEEYPQQKNAVINGFMASLFGLYEAKEWLGDRNAERLWKQGVHSLEAMLPFYTLPWWSLYDRSGPDAGRNLHSPRYKTMVVGYLAVLAALTGSEILAAYHAKWAAMNVLPNRLAAYGLKFVRKLRYR